MRASLIGITGVASMITASYSLLELAREQSPGRPGSAARPDRPSGARRRQHVERVACRRADRVRSSSASASRTSSSPGVRGSIEQLGDPAAAQVAVDEDRRALPRGRASPRAPNATVVLPWLPSGLVTTTERMLSSVKSRFVRRSRSASATTRKLRLRCEVLGRSASSGSPTRRGSREDRARRWRSPGRQPSRPSWSGSRAAEPRRGPGRDPAGKATSSVSLVRGKTGCGRQSRRVQLEQLQRRDSDLVLADAVEQRPSRRERRSRCASRGFVQRALIFMIPVPLERLDRDRGESAARAGSLLRVVERPA